MVNAFSKDVIKEINHLLINVLILLQVVNHLTMNSLMLFNVKDKEIDSIS